MDKAGRDGLLSQNCEQEFVNNEIWNLFKNRFKSDTTEASYWSDIQEFCRMTGKSFDKVGDAEVKRYYEAMQGYIREGRISPLTLTKKFRELHSFAQFILEHDGADSGKRDPFFPYLKHLAKEKPLARSVPVEDMDALLQAASGDLMAYTILTLMYRAGLSSTEITELDGEDDFALYDDGAYVFLPRRREPCYGNRLNSMYISRMMKKYCMAAGIRGVSAEAVRNCCAFNLFAYGASAAQTAAQMGRTELQIRRYKGFSYQENLRKKANDLVKMRIEKPQP